MAEIIRRNWAKLLKLFNPWKELTNLYDVRLSKAIEVAGDQTLEYGEKEDMSVWVILQNDNPTITKIAFRTKTRRAGYHRRNIGPRDYFAVLLGPADIELMFFTEDSTKSELLPPRLIARVPETVLNETYQGIERFRM